MANQNLQEVVTGKVRLSYVHLFAPYAALQGAEPKYSATILLPKTDVVTKQKIDAAINAAIQEGMSTKWNGVIPQVLAIPIYDGDGVRPSDGMAFSEECKGCFVFTASSKQAPEIVDIALGRLTSQMDIYSGIYARVSVRFFPYASNGKNGIGCGLGPVQKLQDGEPLGGRVSAAAAFGDTAGGYIQNPLYGQQASVSSQPIINNFQTPPYVQQPVYPQQQAYQQPSSETIYPGQQVQLDPITGAPVSGGVMGL